MPVSESIKSRQSRVLFRPGKIVATPGALALINAKDFNAFDLLWRHVTGDWGDLCAEDRRQNELSVRRGLRILSSYRVAGERLWIITEATREYTTLLLPEEY